MERPVGRRVEKRFWMLDSIRSRSTIMEGVSREERLEPTVGLYILTG